jgi:hypothetical protein
LDEASFQQLLSAAYVLQEHNDRLRGKEVHADFAQNLSAIVETQKLIQTLQLDLGAAATLVAERVQKITNASRRKLESSEKGELVYRGATGTAVMDAETHVTPASSLSADCEQRQCGEPSRCRRELRQPAPSFFAQRCKIFIAVPVYHAGSGGWRSRIAIHEGQCFS